MTVLVLASASAARAAILSAAGVSFEVVSSGLDEEPVKARALARGASCAEIADELAGLKATSVSARRSGLVLGADQTLEVDGRLLNWADDVAALEEQLLALRGRWHVLHAAAALAERGEIVWRARNQVRVAIRAFSMSFLAFYIARHGDRLIGCVGGYQAEAEGAQLIDEIEGDFFSVLGLPLLSVLGELRKRGLLAQ